MPEEKKLYYIDDGKAWEVMALNNCGEEDVICETGLMAAGSVPHTCPNCAPDKFLEEGQFLWCKNKGCNGIAVTNKLRALDIGYPNYESQNYRANHYACIHCRKKEKEPAPEPKIETPLPPTAKPSPKGIVVPLHLKGCPQEIFPPGQKCSCDRAFEVYNRIKRKDSSMVFCDDKYIFITPFIPSWDEDWD